MRLVLRYRPRLVPVLRVVVMMAVLVVMTVVVVVVMTVVVMVPVTMLVIVVVIVSLVCHGAPPYTSLSGSSTTSSPFSTSTGTAGWSSHTPGEVSFFPESMSKPTS